MFWSDRDDRTRKPGGTVSKTGLNIFKTLFQFHGVFYQVKDE